MWSDSFEHDELPLVLSSFLAFEEITRVEPLGSAGGYSGAQLWRVTATGGVYCIRRWPEGHPSSDHLRFIHQVLTDAGRSGLHFIPSPLTNRKGESFLPLGPCLWEVTPWMRGSANYWEEPDDQKLVNAMEALAQFHLSSRETYGPARAASQGLRERCRQLEELLQRDASIIRSSLVPDAEINLHPLADEILDRFQRHAPEVVGELKRALELQVAIQPVIRDVWHDHILFEGTQVSGLVDFGAMRMESPAGDVARLLGSFVEDSGQKWEIGMRAYRRIRPICNNELRLVQVFDRSTTLIAPMNWLHWVYVKRRSFVDAAAIQSRVQTSLARMRNLGCFRHPWVPIVD